MKVEEGQHVTKGELLYTLSTPELNAKLQQAEAVKSAPSVLVFLFFFVFCFQPLAGLLLAQ